MSNKKLEKANQSSSTSLLREPRAKKKLGLAVPKISMPHEELLQPQIISFPTAPTANDSGNPNSNDLETQSLDFGNPNVESLETQPFPAENPITKVLETQIEEFGNPGEKSLETQKIILGNPNEKSLGLNQPKSEIWKPKDLEESGAIQPKQKNLETRISEKSKTGKYLKKYENARSTEPLHARVEKSVAQRIRHFLVDNKFSLKEFIEVAAVKFMDEFGNPNEKSLGLNQPYDDRRLRLLWKTKPAIINLYHAYNTIFNPNSKWSVKDDDAAAKLNTLDIRLIELGIIQTQGNKNFTGKINSFSYYLPEIENFVELNLPGESVGVMLEINRARWKKITGRELDLTFLKAED